MRAFPLLLPVRTVTASPDPDRVSMQVSPCADEQHCHSAGLECSGLNVASNSTRDASRPATRLSGDATVPTRLASRINSPPRAVEETGFAIADGSYPSRARGSKRGRPRVPREVHIDRVGRAARESATFLEGA